MIPGLGGMNPKKMQGLMKQMGINQDEIDVDRVMIEKSDGSVIKIDNPQVVRISMQGQESFQISGDISEGEGKKFSDDDVKLVMEKTGKDEEEVKKVLEEVDGDIAEAILKMSSA